MKNSRNWIIAITGASGMRYALRLLETLADMDIGVHLVVSESACRVLKEEENISFSQSAVNIKSLINKDAGNITIHNFKDIGASIASGSFINDGMVIVPCSMGTVGALAAGLSQNLIHRAADVTLKEGRRLIIVPRETPLSTIHLENLARLSSFGVKVVPAMPGFYHQPKTIEELVDMQVMKILDSMGIENEMAGRWGK